MMIRAHTNASAKNISAFFRLVQAAICGYSCARQAATNRDFCCHLSLP